MKLTVEKVPEGLKVTLVHDAAKKPLEFVLTPAEVQTFATVMQTAVRSDAFKFEFQK
jgi:hypothetical protein